MASFQTLFFPIGGNFCRSSPLDFFCAIGTRAFERRERSGEPDLYVRGKGSTPSSIPLPGLNGPALDFADSEDRAGDRVGDALGETSVDDSRSVLFASVIFGVAAGLDVLSARLARDFVVCDGGLKRAELPVAEVASVDDAYFGPS